MCFRLLFASLFSSSPSPKRPPVAHQKHCSSLHPGGRHANQWPALASNYAANIIQHQNGRPLASGHKQPAESKLEEQTTNRSSSEINIGEPNKMAARPPASKQTQVDLQQQQQLEHKDEDEDGEQQQQQQQQQQQATTFSIRTASRRHLDFDPEFELADPQAPQRSRWSAPFYFVQAADSQFGMIDSYVHKRTQPGWQEEIQLCRELVRRCNQLQPRPLFLIVCGDLVDSLPGSQVGARQTQDFKRIFSELSPDIPLVCVCGNHDVGDTPTPETIQTYRRTFGDDYFYFTKNEVLFIVINSQFYQDRSQVVELGKQQDQWLEQLLSKCRHFKHTILFEHIPWFLFEPDEADDYFNIRREIRLEWLRKFHAAGVTKIFCGHYHRNAGGWFQGLELVVTTAIGAQIGQDKSGVRLVKVLDDRIEHQFYQMAEIPLEVEL